MSNIDILLATYNGEKYLRPQLDSLLAQRYADFHIIARDDGSSDGTRRILEEYAAAHPGKFTLLPVGENLGVVGNFSALLQASNAPYAMFCDQDDVWHANKIEKTFAAMQALEHTHCGQLPLLVHTDARVMNSDLSIQTYNSRFHMGRMKPEEVTLPKALVEGYFQGSTMMLNRALVEKITPIPEVARMHDMWATIATLALGGHIGVVKEATLDYRRHERTQTRDHKSYKPREVLPKIRSLSQENLAQATAIIEQLGNAMPSAQKQIVEEYIALHTLPYGARQMALIKGGYLRSDPVKTAGMLLFG